MNAPANFSIGDDFKLEGGVDSQHEEHDRMLQSDRVRLIEGSFGREAWVPVYKYERNQRESSAIFCALIPEQMVNDAMKQDSWDLHVGDGAPAIYTHYSPGGARDIYHRYGNDSGIEPLVLHRFYHDVREKHIELCEEFRLYFNLYEDRRHGKFIRIMDSGDEEEVVRSKDGEFQVRMREIKEFISVKQMHLALYFDFHRFSTLAVSDLDLQKVEHLHRGRDITYMLNVWDAQPPVYGDRRSISRLLGKKLIAPRPKRGEQLPTGSLIENGIESFIIEVDEEGEPIEYTSDPDKLGNYFGANPDAPHYLTPVFFRREVLGKYFAQPGKYTVEDGLLRCAGLWGLRIDNNHDKYVVVHLGDLGRDLPSSEQSYWKSFNVPPDGGFSEVAIRRGFLGQWANSQSADLAFKSLFGRFQESWQKSFGWYLFRPLGAGDAHNITGLRIPLSQSQPEFDEQVLALAKILVDSLNEEELAKSGIDVSKSMRGIMKLDAFLEAKGFPRRQELVQYLRDLYSLRSSGSGHRKGSNYDKAAAKFGLAEKGLIDGFNDILKQATEKLEELLTWITQKHEAHGPESPREN